MKVIQIKTPVNLTSGITTPANTILTISEGYTNNKAKTATTLPSQVSTLLYLNAQAIIDNKEPITGIADFTPVFLNLDLPISDYEIMTAEDFYIDAVYEQLVPVYTIANLAIINI